MKLSEAQKLAFANYLLDQFEITPVSALPKSEIELLLFRAMVKSEILSLKSTDFEIGSLLRVSGSKVSSLRYRLRLNELGTQDFVDGLIESITFISVDNSSKWLEISISEKYFYELVVSELLKIKAPIDGSFNRSILKTGPNPFLEILEKLAGDYGQDLRKSIDKSLRIQGLANFADILRKIISLKPDGATVKAVLEYTKKDKGK